MSLSCLTYPFVGLRGLCSSEASSGLYVDALPGISAKKFANIADGIADTAEKSFYDLHEEAKVRLERDFYSLLCNDFYKNHIVASEIKGTIGQDYQDDSLTGQYGFKVVKRQNDPYTNIRVEWIEFRTNVDLIDQKFIITDGCNPKAKCVNLAAGCTQKIYFDYITSESEVMVYSDLQDVTVSKRSFGYCDCEHLDCDLGGTCSCGSNFNLYGIYNNGSEFVTTGTNNGMRASVSSICNAEHLLCRLKSEFAVPFRYMIANLAMEELLMTERSTPILRNSVDDARLFIYKVMGGEDPITGFENKYPLYWKSLKEVVESAKNIISRERSSCFSCSEKRVRKVVTIM